MPLQRTPLGPRTANREGHKDISLYTRGIALGMALIGAKNKAIQIDLDMPCGALRSTLDFADVRPHGILIQKPGRPTTYSEADERNLLRYVRLNPKDTYKEVRVACRLSIKRDTIKRIL
jgi:hypothetical protein